MIDIPQPKKLAFQRTRGILGTICLGAIYSIHLLDQRGALMNSRQIWLSLFIVSMLTTGKIGQAATTYLDGVGAPTLLDAVVLDDFENRIDDAWMEGNDGSLGGISHVGGTLTNTNPTTGALPILRYHFQLSNQPNVPPVVTLGDQPGEFNVLQFDLRYDSLPIGLDSIARGLNVLTGPGFGSQASANVFVVNNDTNTLPPVRNDTVPPLPLDGQWHTYTLVRDSNDTGWGQMYEFMLFSPILHESSIGTRFSLDNVILARSVPESTSCLLLLVGAALVFGPRGESRDR